MLLTFKLIHYGLPLAFRSYPSDSKPSRDGLENAEKLGVSPTHQRLERSAPFTR